MAQKKKLNLFNLLQSHGLYPGLGDYPPKFPGRWPEYRTGEEVSDWLYINEPEKWDRNYMVNETPFFPRSLETDFWGVVAKKELTGEADSFQQFGQIDKPGYNYYPNDDIGTKTSIPATTNNALPLVTASSFTAEPPNTGPAARYTKTYPNTGPPGLGDRSYTQIPSGVDPGLVSANARVSSGASGAGGGFKRVLKHLGAMESPGPDWSLQAQNVGVRSPWSPTNVAWSAVGSDMFGRKKKESPY